MVRTDFKIMELARVGNHCRSLVNSALNIQVTEAIQLVNMRISSQLCYVTKEIVRKNTGAFIGRSAILKWII